jgi:hypothetical protein
MYKKGTQRIAVISLLSLGTLVRCDCEEVTFQAAAKYTPEAVLDFGNVAVTTEKTLDISVLNEGSAGLFLISAAVAANPEKWRLRFEPELDPSMAVGLSPARTASISVTYRPCPEAWETRTIGGQMVDLPKEGFNFADCTTEAVDSTDLTIVEKDTIDGTQRITLSARPVAPPNASVFCQNGSGTCNATDPQVTQCIAQNFGAVTGGTTPCGLVVEVRNSFRDGKAVGDLEIQGITIQVQNIEDLVTTDGVDAGFTVHTLDGTPLSPTPSDPFLVKIPQGMNEGRERFLIRFSGIASGTWDGRLGRSMTGVRLYTSDPDNPILNFAVNGTGAAPDIDWQPTYMAFGPVPQGGSKTLTATITNSGDADLRITSIGFAVDQSMSKFSYTTDRGTAFPMVLTPLPPGNRLYVHVTYSPQVSGQDSDTLVIIHNDIKENNRTEIPITGGAIPILDVEPDGTVIFPIGAPSDRQDVLLSNIGYGDLIVQRMTITGPQGQLPNESADDFVFSDGCSNPCERQVMLCFPGGSCPSNTIVGIDYVNNDISRTDFAELHIESTDPASPEYVVVLAAEDNPCFFPQPIITVVEPTTPCANQPVTVSAAMSDPGGPIVNGMSTGTIIEYTWFWQFSPVSNPPFNPTGAEVTTFIPPQDGVYVLGLHLKNDCGAVSRTPATETINVAATCN